MTPSRTGGRRGGNFEIDRIIRAMGQTPKERRLRLSSGTSNVRRYNRLNGIIDKLVENAQFDILRGLRDGDILPAQLLEADRKDATASTLTDLQLARRLWDRETEDGQVELGAFSTALAKAKAGRTKDRYVDAVQALQRKGARWLGEDATVADLARAPWEEIAAAWGASAADWMHVRRALSRVMTLYLGDKYDPFARKLRQLIPTKKVAKRKTACSPEQFAEIRRHLPPHVDAAVMVMLITGMRDGSEYLRCREADKDRARHELHVPGTKTDESERILQIDPRLWGWIEAGIPARIRYKWLRIYWTRACLAAGQARLVEHEKGTREWHRVLDPALRPRRRAKGESPAAHAAHERRKREELARRPKLRYVGLHLHDLRRFHGQWALDAGVDESKVQASYGHTNPGQTRDYVLRAATLDVSRAIADVLVGPAEDDPRRRRKA